MCSKHLIITATPPTPNGDLHIGHLAGPYLSADIFNRFQKLNSQATSYITGCDVNQSYVVSRAELEGCLPADIISKYGNRIKDSFKNGSIKLSNFYEPNNEYKHFVNGFFNKLYISNKIEEKEVEFLYCNSCKRFCVESYVAGLCPNCMEITKGNICEECGHPNNCVDLIEPCCSFDSGHSIEIVKNKALVFEMEKYRGKLRDFYNGNKCEIRKSSVKLLNELLDNVISDFVITYPIDWGVKIEFIKDYGQVINVWAEMLPGLIYATSKANRDRDLWHEDNTRLVQFLGYDNSYFFLLVHVALLMASEEDYILPSAIITNEFYQLDHKKFSSSKSHAIWCLDAFEKYNSDLVRFYLALTGPETSKSNFSLEEMVYVTSKLLIGPLNNLIVNINKNMCYVNIDENDNFFNFIELFSIRLNGFYGVENFSTRKIVEVLYNFVQWLLRFSDGKQKEHIYLLRGFFAFIVFAEPIIPKFSAESKKIFIHDDKLTWDSWKKNLTHTPDIIPASIINLLKWQSNNN